MRNARRFPEAFKPFDFAWDVSATGYRWISTTSIDQPDPPVLPDRDLGEDERSFYELDLIQAQPRRWLADGLALPPTGEHPRCGRKPTRRVFEWGRRWRRSGRVADHGDRSRPRSRRRSLPWCNGVTGRSRRFVGRWTSARRRSAAGLNRRPSTRERARVWRLRSAKSCGGLRRRECGAR